MGQNTIALGEPKVDVGIVRESQDRMWNVLERLMAEWEQQVEIEDHQSILDHPAPYDHDDNEEAILPSLDRPLWGSTPTRQREDTIPFGRTKLVLNRPKLLGKSPATKISKPMTRKLMGYMENIHSHLWKSVEHTMRTSKLV